MLIFRWIKPMARILVRPHAMRMRDMERTKNYATRKHQFILSKVSQFMKICNANTKACKINNLLFYININRQNTDRQTEVDKMQQIKK